MTTTATDDDGDDQRPRVLVVTVERESFGIPVGQVREVVRATGVHRVPGSPVVLLGIVNVRGAIVTVLDLQAMLSGERAVTAGSVVLLEYGSRLIGLAVHSVRDVRALDPSGDAAEETGDGPLVTLDAVALCARHLHSADERTP
jgi:purine-binding chemotaxis protein CheW